MIENKTNRKKYVSKITEAMAFLEDTKLFLYNWDENKTTEENTKYFLENNIFSRPTRDYTNRILRAFKHRYIFEDDRDKALRLLAKSMVANEIFDRILYYHIAIEDYLLYDFVINFLYDYHIKGREYISSKEAKIFVVEQSDKGFTSQKWSVSLCEKVSRNILTTLRDCHILVGKSKKKLAPLYMPVEAFVYVAQYMSLYREVSSGSNMLSHADWKMFLLDEMLVERMFLEAHQHGYLNYQSAGNLIRIEFKYKTLSEFINAITK